MADTHPMEQGPTAPRHSFGPFAPVVWFFSNVWVGIVLLTLLLIYCSIGSAVPPVRQHPAIEMTEFQWFHWWPFQVLIALFVINMVTVTIRRIPLRWVNAGVWMIHTGIIILVLGSYIYFGQKVEGDAPVFRRQVSIDVPGAAAPARLVALPGASTSVVAAGGPWRFSVSSTNRNWPLRTEQDKGKLAYVVNVTVEPPNGQPFTRMLLDGYPQYTEDVIPGQGRAIKSLGRKLVDDSLSMSLEYVPQDYFHVMDTWALFARNVGDSEWHELPMPELPRYHDRLDEDSFDDVRLDYDLEPRPLYVPIANEDADGPLNGLPLSVTAYLRFARFESGWRDDGAIFNPLIRYTLTSQQSSQTDELIARDSKRRKQADGMAEFLIVADEAAARRVAAAASAQLTIEVPEANFSRAIALTQDSIVGKDGPYTEIEGTDLAYRITGVLDDLAIGEGDVISVALVDLKTPEGEVQRFVADKPERSRERPLGADDAMAGPHATELDPRFKIRYRPGRAAITFLASPDRQLWLLKNLKTSELLPIQVSEDVPIIPGLALRVDTLMMNAQTDDRPHVIRPEQRDRDAGVLYSMIRLRMGEGSAAREMWVPFSQYVFPSNQYKASRFQYQPIIINVPAANGQPGKRVELAFSRERCKLPNPVALDTFDLLTHVGGYTGNTLEIRNYVSKLRFDDDNDWTDPVAIKVNSPTGFGGYWYFQSTWDPPRQDQPGSGMNYTGLGIGNREGVHTQLAGCCIAVLGMIYAFYAKPVIKRRRQQQAWAKVGADESEVALVDADASPVAPPAPAEQLQEVTAVSRETQVESRTQS